MIVADAIWWAALALCLAAIAYRLLAMAGGGGVASGMRPRLGQSAAGDAAQAAVRA